MFKCFHCDKEIKENEEHITINVHREVLLDDYTIQVNQADCMNMYCFECSKLFDFDNIIIPLKVQIS